MSREMIYVSVSIQQSGHLDVVVSPDILNAPELSADESVTNEVRQQMFAIRSYSNFFRAAMFN